MRVIKMCIWFLFHFSDIFACRTATVGNVKHVFVLEYCYQVQTQNIFECKKEKNFVLLLHQGLCGGL